MSFVTTCPECGHRAPWEPPARAPESPVPIDEVDVAARRGIRVRCLATPPGVTRQMRRTAERSGRPIVCGAEFVVRPLPPDDEQAIDSGVELPDPDRPLTVGDGDVRRMGALLPLLLAATAAVPSRGSR